MKVTVLGATGGVGSHVVDLLLDHGHTVTVLARTPSKVSQASRITVVQGDALDADVVRHACQGADVVISALGSTRGDGRDTSLRRMAASLAETIEAGDANRVIWCASEGVDGEIPGLVGKLVMRMLAKPLADHGAALQRLRDAGAVLVVARPRSLNDGPLDITYTEVLDGPADGTWSIARHSVAHFLVKAAEDASYDGKSVALAKRK